MNYYLISLIVGLVLFFFSLYELYTGRSAKLFIVIGLVGAFLWVLPVGFANNEVEVPYIVADKKIKNINLDMKDELVNDEVVVYDDKQATIRYLIELA